MAAQINPLQQRVINDSCQALSEHVSIEIKRLMNSGMVSPDKNGEWPLSTILRVALENVADRYAAPNRRSKDYQNLKKA